MPSQKELFANNKAWAADMLAQDPDYFGRLSRQQRPQYFWIGCSDSRVPANVIAGLPPGEVFVHRNISNVVVHTDLNFLSVLQFAVEVLEVSRIIVCGHYGCGGIAAAMENKPHGLIDAWLHHIRDVQRQHTDQLAALPDESARRERLCELNVVEQAMNVCETSIVQEAWRAGQQLAVMGWIYDLKDGLLRDLGFSVESPAEMKQAYEVAIAPK
ncbi:MAG: carbonate dehydratase [Kiritimatiellae bacterium]|nr:carbonate dehydratase [Kiritimatiellia bacterium]